VMLGVSIFWVKDMFVIEFGSIDWARLRTVSIKEGEIEIQESFVESRGKAVCLSLFAISSAGKESWNHGCVGTVGISYGPNHS
jgi:hypothetical protein